MFGEVFKVKKLTKILKEITDLEFGFCNFKNIENNLLNCRARFRLPENSKTVILFIFPFKCEENKPLNISRYASVKDYHIVVENILKEISAKLSKKLPENKFECFTDNSPIPEVRAAALAGLGVTGKNNLLINEKYGSFIFIGEIVTDYAIKFHPTVEKSCIGCNRCLENCPNNALNTENICLSALTQKKGKLEKREENLILKGGSVWGCDICQEVCPMNKNKENTFILEFLNSYRNEYKPDENNKDRAYNWRGPDVIKRNYEIFKKSNIT